MADEIELLHLVSELIPEPTTDAWARAKAAIASAREEEDLLRGATERSAKAFPTLPRTSGGPARRHRWRLALWSATGATAALAACLVVILLASGVPGARHNRTAEPAVDTAYVVKRVDSALGVAGLGLVAQLTVTTTASTVIPGGTTAEEWSHGDQWRSVTYSSAGRPVFDASFSSSSVYTLVNYQARTWARQPGLGRPAGLVPGSRGCEPAVAALTWLFQPGLAGPGFAGSSQPSTVASALRAAISCGTLADTGRQRVDGTEAIELVSRPGNLIAETIWVSPGTYLPVRAVIRPGPGLPLGQRTADITWLRPTAQNLAKLTVPIPAAFRQVPLAEAGTIVP